MADERSAAPRLIRETAPAKINLYLHILGRRDDGFHLIDSLVAFVDIGDELTATRAHEIALDVTGPFAVRLRSGSDNLVLGSARSLAAAFGIAEGARLTLTKNLPVAAGLGGGSSDAAAALRALARLWGVELGDERVMDVARELGSDVPVCVDGRPAFIGGIGHDIEPAPELPMAYMVLVNPGVGLATKDVYGVFARCRAIGARESVERLRGAIADVHALADALCERANDLTVAAGVLVPQVTAVLAFLESLPGALVVRMTGSGPTCFALFAEMDAAAKAAEACRAHEPSWWVARARLADRPASEAA